ncbi:MAG: hypothetical protein LLG20_02570 [Acidobacteriales bacterium]|nr:hypothetical protein [Terriglobales bacterium]
MPLTRKLALDFMRDCMAEPTYGFNAMLAALRDTYAITDSVEIDWSAESQSIFVGQINPSDASRTALTGRVTLQLSTGGSMWTGETKGSKWSGRIEGNIIITVRYSNAENPNDGIESGDLIERWVQIIEDAVIAVFGRETIPWNDYPGLSYGSLPDCPQLPDAELSEDGWEQVIPLHLNIKIDAN